MLKREMAVTGDSVEIHNPRTPATRQTTKEQLAYTYREGESRERRTCHRGVFIGLCALRSGEELVLMSQGPWDTKSKRVSKEKAAGTWLSFAGSVSA